MLETKRCVLNKLSEEDYDNVKLLYMNKEVRKYLGGTREESSLKAGFTEMIQSTTDSLYLVVREKYTHDFIGLVSLDTHHDGISTEVSYQLLPKWWRKGYASEVVNVVIHYAFTTLILPELVAETQTVNKASCRLLEKLGMRLREKVQRFGAEQTIFSISNKLG